MRRSYLQIAAFILTLAGASAAASAHEGEGVYNPPDCPLYKGCDEGMAGFVTGMGADGCEIFKCVPAAEARTVPHFDDHDHAPVPVAPQPTTDTNSVDENATYQYKKPQSTPSAGSRLIDVQ